ncbi:hypothetical protein K737_300496 [Holospora undulata HU1]|uniref:Uncharacterized protein n=1 Tax=Holospora undulata HU1 TaxID=1321371 RepID=A0A061JHW1_9PROT|nr:hypothetical protein K737_300496 [Holospora undulata HU1]
MTQYCFEFRKMLTGFIDNIYYKSIIRSLQTVFLGEISPLYLFLYVFTAYVHRHHTLYPISLHGESINASPPPDCGPDLLSSKHRWDPLSIPYCMNLATQMAWFTYFFSETTLISVHNR